MLTRPARTARPCLEELESRLVPSAVATTSTNWSGYAVATGRGAVTAVSGTWVVPAASGSGTAFSSAWVGIDGCGSSTVEQIGTDSDLVNGSPRYYAWYEMYPGPSVELPLAIHAGDTISAAVSYASGTFTLSLTDVSTGQSYRTTQVMSGAQRWSAEWVVEAPSSTFGVLPLANFGKASFTGAQATAGGTGGPIDGTAWTGSRLYQINMVSRSGAPLETTSGLTDSGSPTTSAFTVTYLAASPTPAPPPRPRGRLRQPDQAVAPEPVTTTTVGAAASVAVALSLVGAGPRTAAPQPAPAAALHAASQPAVIPAALAVSASPSRQGPLSGTSRAPDAGDLDGGPADQPAAPGALPAPRESGDQSTTPPPDRTPSPVAGAAVLPETAWAADVCFVERRWAPEATSDAPVMDSTGLGLAGVLLGLAVIGPWEAPRAEVAKSARVRGPRLRFLW